MSSHTNPILKDAHGAARRARWIVMLLGWIALCAAVARPQAASGRIPRTRSLPEANTVAYALEVGLDHREKILKGSQVVTWTNRMAVATEELRFHLYFNAWRNSQSTWLRESIVGPERRRKELDQLEADHWAYCDVTSIRLRDSAEDLSEEAYFDAPDDGNPEDRTVLVVPLTRPVEPGKTVHLEMEWVAKIPRTFARTGYRGDFFFLAHWFPKLGVYQADGSWNCHQFHVATEFFSDYGTYDVKMTVPAGWYVGATGREVDVADNNDGTSTHHYREERVHGFAWTTSPHYQEARQRFEVSGLEPVEMRLLYQPEHASQVDRHFQAAAAALEHYGTWFGEYPYGHLTIIDPAWGSGVGGMEYPTLFTVGTRYFNPEGGGRPESVTIHEAGHQFWYGIVGSNEFEDAWLDEGLTTFSSARVYDEVYGPRFYVKRFFREFLPVIVEQIPLERAISGNRLDRYRRAARRDVPSTPTYRYFPSTASGITYAKTALWLATLERDLGWEKLQRILRTFFQRWKFRHPGPEDFFAVANEVTGRDLTFFFDQVYRSTAVFDYSVDLVSSEKQLTRGYLRLREKGDLVYYEEFKASAEEGTESSVLVTPYETRVVVRRLQDGVHPVEVLLAFEDGEERREIWDGKDQWKLYHVLHPARLNYAAVDPERKILLDINYTNNSKMVDGEDSLAAAKWATKWMIWVQDFFQTLSFLV